MNNKEFSYIDYYNKALLKLSENNISEGIYLLEKAYLLNSSDIDILNLLGLSYFKKGYFNKAKMLFEKSLLINKEEERALRYISFFNSKEFRESLGKYEEALDCIEEKKYNKALEILLSLKHLPYEWADIDFFIGMIYLKKKSEKNALKYLEGALNKDKGNILSKDFLEKLRENKREKRKNIISFSTISVVILLGGLFFSKEKEEIKKLQGEKYSLKEEILSMKEEVKEREVRLNKDIESLKEKIKVEEREKEKIKKEYKEFYPLSSLNMSLKKYEKGEYKEALQGFSEIEKGNYENYIKGEAIFWQGQSYEKLGEEELAIEKYKAYVENFKNQWYYDDSLYRLALILDKRGEEKESRFYGEKLKKECKDSIFNNEKINSLLKNENI